MTKFKGSKGKAKRIEIISRNPAIQSNVELAKFIDDKSTLRSFTEKEEIIIKGNFDDEVYFILDGSVDIILNGSVIATRKRPDTVGEMAAMDPGSSRSATVKVSSSTMTALEISASRLHESFSKFPEFEKNLGSEIRGRQRQQLEKNDSQKSQPNLFHNFGFWVICLSVLVSVLIFSILSVPNPALQFRMTLALVGGLIFANFLFFRQPKYFYRRWMGITIASGLMIVSTGIDFVVDSGSNSAFPSIKFDNEIHPAFFGAWIVIIIFLGILDFKSNK